MQRVKDNKDIFVEDEYEDLPYWIINITINVD